MDAKLLHHAWDTIGTMPAVTPEILVWACETAGLTLQNAVAKVGIKDARGVAAIDRLAALERGEEKPTRPTLVRLAHHYRPAARLLSERTAAAR